MLAIAVILLFALHSCSIRRPSAITPDDLCRSYIAHPSRTPEFRASNSTSDSSHFISERRPSAPEMSAERYATRFRATCPFLPLPRSASSPGMISNFSTLLRSASPLSQGHVLSRSTTGQSAPQSGFLFAVLESDAMTRFPSAGNTFRPIAPIRVLDLGGSSGHPGPQADFHFAHPSSATTRPIFAEDLHSGSLCMPLAAQFASTPICSDRFRHVSPRLLEGSRRERRPVFAEIVRAPERAHRAPPAKK